ncbi:PIG-L family deacetylase [Dehalobacter sp. DCM]|uniref:PIG-L deacetylase family protein n=1 Tax=Dehalobacter sp. DCM TaxID=2907827 RepID=UPI0030821EB3|nr:PIG-L family deacetylase [Dehalobacter sp. DCM]
MKRNSKRRLILSMVTVMIGLAFILTLSGEVVANYSVSAMMQPMNTPGPDSRLLIIAPHPDDETLGAGMLIKKTLANGGQVKVILMTNGDAYSVAAHLDLPKVKLTSKDYIDFGYQRQKESLNALKMLGVSEVNVIFLGYPDGGLAPLWSANWETAKPNTSAHTLMDQSPYSNSFQRSTLYCGQSVVNDLTKIITDYRPTDIIMPHPNDRHPDHWATNAFVKYTLTVMNYDSRNVWLYLVHRGLWPAPEASHTTSRELTPPAKLLETGTQWYTFTLTASEANWKRETLKKYTSQLKTLGYQMSCFAKRSELFGQYADTTLVRGLHADSEITPNAVNEIIRDPAQDKIVLNLDKGADLLTVHAEISKEGHLHLILQTDKPIDPLSEYHFNLVVIKNETSAHFTFMVKGNKVRVLKPSNTDIILSGFRTHSMGNDLELTLPSSSLGQFNHLFIDAESFFNHVRTDKTAWRMLD